MNTTQPQQNYPGYFNDESLDVKRYISLFISNWYWFVIALFVSLSIAYGINRWSEEVYRVSSTLLIKEDPSTALSDIFPGTGGFRNQQNVNNEIGILKSFKLNNRVMEQMPEFMVVYTSVGRRGIAESRMYKNSPFVVVYDSLKYQTIGKKIYLRILSASTYSLRINGEKNKEREYIFGQRFNEAGFDFMIKLRDNGSFIYNPDASNKYFFYFVSPASLANSYRGKLSVTPVEEEASLVTLTTTGFVVQQEVDYLNRLMDVYLDFGLEYKNQTAAQSLDFIERQLGTISDSLKKAENELEGFRLYNNLIDISREGTIIQSRLEQIDEEKTELLIQKNYYEYLKGYIESKNDASDIVAPSVMGVTDQLLIRLVGELSELQKQKRQLSMNLYESAEPLKVLEAEIAKERSALMENVISSLQNLGQSIDNADSRLAEIEKEIKKLPSTERQMINIQRKFDINNTVYTFLLEKRAEAGIARASNVPDNRIIDQAGSYSSAMIRPRKSHNIFMATILGLLIPLVLIVLIDYLNNRIIDKKDIEKKTTAPVVGYISHNRLHTEMPVVANPGSTLSESFRGVRTNLKYFLSEKKCSVISVSSTITGEGKTFISANLAAIMALSGKKILLVGLDLRKPRIHKIFGIDNEKGVSNFLIGECDFAEVVIKTDINNLWYAPSGPVPPNPAELIESERMRSFFVKAKEQFEFIIIDTPPVAVVTDTLLISPYTDFYLFVVRQRYTSRNTLELIEELNNNKKITSLGIVINDISTTGYYGYGLRYGYSMGYGYNYGYNYYSYYGRYGYTDSGKGYYTDDV